MNLLRVLHALVEERSVTRAAGRLGLSQPAVSGMLVRLRDAFGDPLLVRGRRGMVPTQRALGLEPPLRQVLADVEGLLRPPRFDPASAEFVLHVAASDYALGVLLEPVFALLRSRAPGVKVAVHPLSAALIGDQLETGAIDVAVMPSGAGADLHARELFREAFVCILRADHPAVCEEWTLDLFCRLDHALVAFDGSFDGLTDLALAGIGRERRVVLSVASFELLSKLVVTTDIVAVVPARLVARNPAVAVRTPPVPVAGFAISAVWHARSHRDPARAWARSILFEASDRLAKVRSE